MFVATLFSMAKSGKEPKCQLTGKWVNSCVYTHNRIYSSIKRNKPLQLWYIYIYKKMDKFQNPYAGWKNPDIKQCILYDSVYKKLQEIQNYSDRKQISSCQRLGVGGEDWLQRGTGKFGGDRNALYLHISRNRYMFISIYRNYTTVYICQDSYFTLETGEFHCV